MNIKNKTIIPVAVVAAIAAISGTVLTFNGNIFGEDVQYIHSSIQNYDLEYLAKETQYAIIGKVTEITPVIVERDGMKTVFSDVTLKVEKDLNGNYEEKEITVRIQGGEKDGLKTVSDIDASFERNERVLIFVPQKEPESIWGDNYYVAGMYQGKFNLSNGKAYGHEHTDGLEETEFISKIQKSRGLN